MTTSNSHRFSKPGYALTRRRALALGAAGLIASSSRHAGAQTRLQITEGNFQPIPIAIPKFIAGGAGDSDMANSVSQVVTADLQRSGLFNVIDPAAYTETIASVDAVPTFQSWRVVNAQALVCGAITRHGPHQPAQ